MSRRTDRINDELMKAISEVIRELKDPRIHKPQMVSVCSVDAASDLSYAKVYISVMGSQEQKDGAMASLSSASGFLRRRLGEMLKIRQIPEIKFILDGSIEYGAHINALLKNLGDENRLER